jgi:hypothetical protein
MRRIMVAGMPSSGKSTYIAALRHVLLSDETESALTLARPARDEKHLNALQDRWLASERFERTREASEAWVTFHVRARAGGVEAELMVPDLRGETFERPAASGDLADEVLDALVDCAGLMLFTNADRPDDSNLISDIGEFLDDDDREAQETASPVRSFQPDQMPEEPKLVELLQVGNRRPRVRRLRRLALVASAWDVVVEAGSKLTPAEWLERERPMLSQFLANNANLWDVRVYGASAQGGRLPRDRARLQALENASERIIIVGLDAASHDPTAPIAWLLSGA